MATFRTSQVVSALDPSRPHIVLVGLPGAGKSTVGMRAAEKAGRSFLDLDREIERREGQTVAEIFAQKGEPAFRQMERDLTAELTTIGGMIVAPGGGWIADPENVAKLAGHSILVWLKVFPETAIARLKKETTVRPLLQRPEPLVELRKLLQQREPLYAKAAHTIDTDKVSVDETVRRVAELAGGVGRV
ncbi:MAG TPA: shikimate kinase [Gemmatimonadaceae bacterium]|nr:shikimate kinase [Gemmatimonadaceae bacterium]